MQVNSVPIKSTPRSWVGVPFASRVLPATERPADAMLTPSGEGEEAEEGGAAGAGRAGAGRLLLGIGLQPETSVSDSEKRTRSEI
jgi:hypothetical protein